MKGCFWLFVLGFAIATILWVIGPVYWVVRKNPPLTIFSYASWLMASEESKFVLIGTLAALILMVSLVICRYFWSRIRVRQDQNINHRNAELEARENKLEARQQAFNAKVSTTMQKAEREAKAIIAQAKTESQKILNDASKESSAIMEQALVDDAKLKSLGHEESRQILDCATQEAATIIAQAGEEAQVVLNGAKQESAEIVAKAQEMAANLEFRSKEESQKVLGNPRHEAAAEAWARSQDDGNGRLWQSNYVQERFSPFQDLLEPETPPDAMHEHGQVESTKTIRQIDILIGVHGLSARQARALEHISENASINIQEFERLYPDITRRTLQRDLKEMVAKGLLILEGATHHVTYRRKT